MGHNDWRRWLPENAEYVSYSNFFTHGVLLEWGSDVDGIWQDNSQISRHSRQECIFFMPDSSVRAG